jgi:hypothetical protein
MKAYLKDGTVPENGSTSTKYRFRKKCERFFLDKEDQIIFLSNTIPPELTDKEGKPLIHVTLPLKFIVADPRPENIERIIGTCFSSTMSGGHKGVDSLYKKISQEYIGISRQDVSDFMKRSELKQLKRPTLMNDLKPILSERIGLRSFNSVGLLSCFNSDLFIKSLTSCLEMPIYS